MKNIKLTLLVFLFLSSCLWVFLYFTAPENKGTLPPATANLVNDLETKGAFDFESKDIYGKTFKLSDYKGKVIILNFWASWCEPCVEEIPSLLRVIEHFKGEVILVAISADYTLVELNKFLKVFKAKSPYLKVAWDNEKLISKKYMVEALPESFIIGKDFKLARKVPGSENWATKNALLFFKDLVDRVVPE